MSYKWHPSRNIITEPFSRVPKYYRQFRPRYRRTNRFKIRNNWHTKVFKQKFNLIIRCILTRIDPALIFKLAFIPQKLSNQTMLDLNF